jgi:SAM-dependent methyltransferase
MDMKRTGIRSTLISTWKNFAIKHGHSGHPMFSVYNYMFDPEQLRFLMDCILATQNISGACVEAGCAKGATTAFLRKWMHCRGIEKQYFAIDTFSGFPAEQASYEVEFRNKPRRIKYAFTDNKKEWFDHSMRLAGINDVKSVEADVARFDFDRIGAISFCLLDVDLFLPISEALPKIYKNLSPGGLILVDDCAPDRIYDGALEAYQEFVQSKNLEPSIAFEKFGLIRKPMNHRALSEQTAF